MIDKTVVSLVGAFALFVGLLWLDKWLTQRVIGSAPRITQRSPLSEQRRRAWTPAPGDGITPIAPGVRAPDRTGGPQHG